MNNSPHQARLEVEEVSHSFHGRVPLRVLSGISFTCGPGERIAILGPSGCGKSTLLRCIAGLLKPSSGRITIDGQSPRKLVDQQALAVGFQDSALLPWRTAAENIRIGSELRSSSLSAAEADHRTEHLLELVDLTKFQNYLPHQLSGGMKKRVALARAIFNEPQLLLLDEPLAGLDLLTRRQLMAEVERVLCATNATAVVVTHSIEEAVFWGDLIIVLTSRPARILSRVQYMQPHPRGEQVLDDRSFAVVREECEAYLLARRP